MKKVVYILVLVVSILPLTGCGCEKEKKDEHIKDVVSNNKEDIVKDQSLENFTFTKTSLVYDNGTSYITTSVKNNSTEKEYLQEFLIHVKDENGNDIVSTPGFVGDYFEPGEEKLITSSYRSDLTNAASITYEIRR